MKQQFAIMELSHSLEKGLSLRKPKKWFGENKVLSLFNLLNLYPHDDFYKNLGFSTLEQYFNYNTKYGNNKSEILKNIEKVIKEDKSKTIIKTGYIEEINNKKLFFDNFKNFVYSRHSIRDFKNQEIDLKEILECIKVAQRTPSQCNRQSAKVHIYKNTKEVYNILNFQGGARGFRKYVPCLIVVTNDLSGWDNANERNQCFIDGALFANTLLYALHSHDFGTCPMNTAFSSNKENTFKKLFNINKSERLIMIIALGKKHDKVKYACSPRKNIDEISILHK